MLNRTTFVRIKIKKEKTPCPVHTDSRSFSKKFCDYIKFSCHEVFIEQASSNVIKRLIKPTKNQNRDRADTEVLTTQLFIGRRNNGRVGKRFSAAARSLPILRFVCAGLFVFRACAWLRRSEATPTCIKTSTRHGAKLKGTQFYVNKIVFTTPSRYSCLPLSGSAGAPMFSA